MGVVQWLDRDKAMYTQTTLLSRLHGQQLWTMRDAVIHSLNTGQYCSVQLRYDHIDSRNSV